ncbi:hypothetical protein [Burkholderia sp. BCC1993]|uniref:hypothetical protein n=1 Tax=Burkholderia sp. BCC1993 TaxID=2817444 RepID=UPI002AB033DF|nr:hypothetical protein [Burkholderia sp. BCC1993]
MEQSLRPRARPMVRVERFLETKILLLKQLDISHVLYCGMIFGIAKQRICAVHHEFLQSRDLFHIVKNRGVQAKGRAARR